MCACGVVFPAALFADHCSGCGKLSAPNRIATHDAVAPVLSNQMKESEHAVLTTIRPTQFESFLCRGCDELFSRNEITAHTTTCALTHPGALRAPLRSGPDLAVEVFGALRLLYDQTVAHVMAPSNLGYTDVQLEDSLHEKKNRLYLDQAKLNGYSFSCLVFFSLGGLGTKTRNELRDVASLLGLDPIDFCDRTSAAVMMGVGRSISNALAIAMKK